MVGGLLISLNPIDITLVAGIIHAYLGLKITRPASGSNILHPIGYGALMVSLTLSTLLAPEVKRALMLNAAILPAWFLAGIIAMGFNQAHSIRWFYRVVALIVFTMGIMALVAAYPFTSGDPSTWMKRLSLIYLAVPNDLLYGGILAVVLVAILISDEWRVCRWLAGLGLITWFAVAISYRSHAVLLALTIHFIFFARARSALWFACAILLGMVLDAALGFPMWKKLLSLPSWWSRIPLWQAAWQMFMDAPLWGQGTGSFQSIGADYVAAARAGLPEWMPTDSRRTPWPHNIYLETLAERGLWGFTVLLGFLARVVQSILKRRHWNLGESLGEWLLARVTAAMLSSVAVTGLFDASINRFWFWIVLAILAGHVSVLIGMEKGEKHEN